MSMPSFTLNLSNLYLNDDGVLPELPLQVIHSVAGLF